MSWLPGLYRVAGGSWRWTGQAKVEEAKEYKGGCLNCCLKIKFKETFKVWKDLRIGKQLSKKQLNIQHQQKCAGQVIGWMDGREGSRTGWAVRKEGRRTGGAGRKAGDLAGQGGRQENWLGREEGRRTGWPGRKAGWEGRKE